MNKRPSYSLDRKRLMKKEHENKNLAHVTRFWKFLLAKIKTSTIRDHISVVFCFDKTCSIFSYSNNIALWESMSSFVFLWCIWWFIHIIFSSIQQQISWLLINFWWHFIYGSLNFWNVTTQLFEFCHLCWGYMQELLQNSWKTAKTLMTGKTKRN